jgi:hypothetical protein
MEEMKNRYSTKIQIILLLIITAGFTQCSKSKSPGTLSPARSIVGTWTTPSAVTMYMTSDGCGNYVRYNSTPVKMTWDVTYVDDSHVDITISSSFIGTTTQIGSNCGLPATLNFPLYMHGLVSSSHLTLQENQMQYSSSGAALGLSLIEIGSFNLTTNNITGTITEKDCPVYCAGYETDASKCILTK